MDRGRSRRTGLNGGKQVSDLISVLSRRNLIVGLVGTAAAGTAAAGSGFIDAAGFMALLRPNNTRRGVTLRSGESGDWADQRDTQFRLDSGQVLKLADVQSFKSTAKKEGKRPRGVRSTAFVARFDIKQGGPLDGDRIFRINHARGGVFDIYLTTPDPRSPLQVAAVFS